MAANPDFRPDTVRSDMMGLTFQQTSKDRNSWSISVSVPGLSLSGSVEDRTFNHTPAKDKNNFSAPRVTLNWSCDNGTHYGSETFVGNFSMVLETGKLLDGTIPAKIHLCLPDEGKTVLAGTFKLTGHNGRPLVFTRIHGRLETPPAINEKAFYVGSAGMGSGKKAEAEGSHLRLNEYGELPSGMRINSNGAQGSEVSSTSKEGAAYSFRGRLPGWHLIVLAAAGVQTLPEPERTPGFMSFGPREDYSPLPRIYDVRWIEIKDPHADVECNLSADPDRLGVVIVEVPGVRDGALVSFLPAAPDELKKAPEVDGVSPCMRVRVKDGRTDKIELPEGTYDFRCEGRKQRITIERQKTMPLKLLQEI